MLALTFAPCILTFASCTCGVSLLSIGANTPLGGCCHQLQFALEVLFNSGTSTDSPLAHMVVSPSATCNGDTYTDTSSKV